MVKSILKNKQQLLIPFHLFHSFFMLIFKPDCQTNLYSQRTNSQAVISPTPQNQNQTILPPLSRRNNSVEAPSQLTNLYVPYNHANPKSQCYHNKSESQRDQIIQVINGDSHLKNKSSQLYSSPSKHGPSKSHVFRQTSSKKQPDSISSKLIKSDRRYHHQRGKSQGVFNNSKGLSNVQEHMNQCASQKGLGSATKTSNLGQLILKNQLQKKANDFGSSQETFDHYNKKFNHSKKISQRDLISYRSSHDHQFYTPLIQQQMDQQYIQNTILNKNDAMDQVNELDQEAPFSLKTQQQISMSSSSKDLIKNYHLFKRHQRPIRHQSRDHSPQQSQYFQQSQLPQPIHMYEDEELSVFNNNKQFQQFIQLTTNSFDESIRLIDKNECIDNVHNDNQKQKINFEAAKLQQQENINQQILRKKEQFIVLKHSETKKLTCFPEDLVFIQLDCRGYIFPLKLKIFNKQAKFQLYGSYKKKQPTSESNDLTSELHDILIERDKKDSNWYFLTLRALNKFQTNFQFHCYSKKLQLSQIQKQIIEKKTIKLNNLQQFEVFSDDLVKSLKMAKKIGRDKQNDKKKKIEEDNMAIAKHFREFQQARQILVRKVHAQRFELVAHRKVERLQEKELQLKESIKMRNQLYRKKMIFIQNQVDIGLRNMNWKVWITLYYYLRVMKQAHLWVRAKSTRKNTFFRAIRTEMLIKSYIKKIGITDRKAKMLTRGTILKGSLDIFGKCLQEKAHRLAKENKRVFFEEVFRTTNLLNHFERFNVLVSRVRIKMSHFVTQKRDKISNYLIEFRKMVSHMSDIGEKYDVQILKRIGSLPQPEESDLVDLIRAAYDLLHWEHMSDLNMSQSIDMDWIYEQLKNRPKFQLFLAAKKRAEKKVLESIINKKKTKTTKKKNKARKLNVQQEKEKEEMLLKMQNSKLGNIMMERFQNIFKMLQQRNFVFQIDENLLCSMILVIYEHRWPNEMKMGKAN